ncbi:MAG TPA: tripartite tricarboxylate transporter TctB family protein [Alphaproteobacteria bacterium]|nr:tripartite tricarboxylate transporter TctB family protein [Alphaproteobacteria bacterium]
MKLNDTVTGGAFAALGVALIAISWSMEPLDHIPYGPGLFPTIVGSGMVLFGSILILSSFGTHSSHSAADRAEDAQEATPRRASSAVPLAAFVAAPLLYVVAAPTLGFLIVMPLVIGGLIGILRGRWLSSVAIGVVVTVILQILFQRFMLVPLPWGVLEPWSGVLT